MFFCCVVFVTLSTTQAEYGVDKHGGHNIILTIFGVPPNTDLRRINSENSDLHDFKEAMVDAIYYACYQNEIDYYVSCL